MSLIIYKVSNPFFEYCIMMQIRYNRLIATFISSTYILHIISFINTTLRQMNIEKGITVFYSDTKVYILKMNYAH